MTKQQQLKSIILKTNPLDWPYIEDVLTEPEDSVDTLDAIEAFFQVSFDVEKEMENGG